MESRIFLIGFMGSGKSTLGRALASEIGYDFVDLDKVIETQSGMPITEIFGKFGEHGFREKERDALRSLESAENTLVATGGGTPCFYDNMYWMNSIGQTLFIDCTVETLVDRLRSELDQRPLIRGFDDTGLKNFIINKLAERMPFYSQAELHVFGINDVSKMVQWIRAALNQESN